ncbi:MAG TPA: hypothetical protein VHE30_23880 [Polyangiaceae bacterium]|nr:hypothetical protein [Polyangiaceae bacterium]
MEPPRVRLGELLVRAGLITDAQLGEALAEQQRVGGRLGTLLVDSGLVSETQVTQILSQQLSVPWVSLHHIDFTRELLNLVPVDLVERYCLIPIYVRRVRGLGDALYIAMDDPTNQGALQEAAERSRLHVRAMIAPPSDIRAAIRAYYGVGAEPAPPPMQPEQAERLVAQDEEEDVPTGIHPRAEMPTKPGGDPLPVPVAPKPPPTAGELDSAVDALVGKDPEVSVRTSRADELLADERAPAVPPVPPAKPGAELGSGPRAKDASSPAAAAKPDVPPSAPASSRKDDAPASSRASRAFGTGKPSGERARTAKGGRMIALTLLDGTTIRLPGKGGSGSAPEEEAAAAPAPPTGNEELTARDLVAALRAASHGADASEILGENVRWEAMVAALLSVLLKKHLITDWEFVEELKKG